MVYLSSLRSAISMLLLASLITTTASLPQSLAEPASIRQETGQVTINEPNTNTDAASTTTPLPITITIFSSSPGPKSCRGVPISTLVLPPPPPPSPPTGPAIRTGPQCYNLPSTASCGTFVAAKESGCEARLFSEPSCVLYVNTAVFMPEERALGGAWRSFSVECGIPAPDEDSLGVPPLEGMGMDVRKKGG